MVDAVSCCIYHCMVCIVVSLSSNHHLDRQYPILAIRDCPILPDYRLPSSPRVARLHVHRCVLHFVYIVCRLTFLQARIIRSNSTVLSRNNSPVLDVLDKARVIMLSMMRVCTAPPIIRPSAPIAFQARGCLCQLREQDSCPSRAFPLPSLRTSEEAQSVHQW
jgi:hypothetical protein